MTPLTDEQLIAKVAEIVKTDPRLIVTFKGSLLTEETWEYAVSMMPELFPLCKKKTYRIAAAAISADGFHLGNIDPLNYTTDQYQKLCELAIAQNPKALIVVPKEFRTENMVSYAYARDPELMLQKKELSPALVESMLDHNPSLIQYVVEPTEAMMIRALSKDPRVIVYCKNITPGVRDFYEENFPQYAAMFIHY